MEIELTDPANELGGVIKWMIELESQEPAAQALARAWMVDAGSVEYAELIAILRRRVHRLDMFAGHLVDRDFDNAQRSQITTAARRFQNALNPLHSGMSWDALKQMYVKADDALAFTWFGNIARRHRPLRRLSEEDREAAIHEFERALQGVQEDAEIPAWAREPLIDGLERLLLSLRYFRFFGHEVTIEQLHQLKAQVTAVERASDHSPNVLSRIYDIAQVIAVIVTLFDAPDQTATAFARYRGWLLRDAAPPQLSYQPPALIAPPPTAEPEVANDIPRISKA